MLAIVESERNGRKRQRKRGTQITSVEAVTQGQCRHYVEGDAVWLV